MSCAASVPPVGCLETGMLFAGLRGCMVLWGSSLHGCAHILLRTQLAMLDFLDRRARVLRFRKALDEKNTVVQQLINSVIPEFRSVASIQSSLFAQPPSHVLCVLAGCEVLRRKSGRTQRHGECDSAR